MAAGKSVLKLVVDDKEYGNKLKNAQNALTALEKVLQGTGKDFTQVDKAVVEYARSLGQMGAQATTARGKIGEMSNAFTELSLKYRQLTDEEKKSPFGQALSASLDQLRTRTINAKRELEDLNKELSTTQAPKGGGGLFSGDKMSGMLQVLGGNLMTKGITMAASALSNLTSEISQCVSQGVELAKQGEGIRNAFERLGRGDLLAGLREATHGTVTDLELMKAAVKFDDFKLNLDELGTMLAFAQQKAKDTGQSVDYMVDSIVTGLGRKSLMILDNLGLSATEIRERMKETGDMTKAVGSIIRDQMAKSGEYIETAADRAAQANVDLQNKMEELGRKFAPVEEASTQLWTSMKIAILDVVSGPLARLLNGLSEAGRLRNMLNDMNGTGSDGQTHTGRALGALRHYSGNKQGLYNRQVARYNELESNAWRQANGLRTQLEGLRRQQRENGAAGNLSPLIADVSKQLERAENTAKAWQKLRADYMAGARSILNPVADIAGSAGGTGDGKNGKGGGGKTTKQEIDAVTGSIDAQAKKVAELQKAWRAAADDSAREDYKKQIEEAQFELEKLEGKTSGIPGMNYGMGDLAGKGGSGLFQDPLFTQNTYDSDNWMSKSIAHSRWKLDDKAIKSIGDEFERVTKEYSPKEKLEIATQNIGQIASGLSGITSGLQQLGIEVPQGIQQAIGILQGISSILAAIQTISAIKLWSNGGVIHAASGMIVPGNNYSGDMVPSMINSGELILNRAQQGAVASQLQDNQRRAPQIPYVSGENIYAGLSNYLRRIGAGEIVTWRG